MTKPSSASAPPSSPTLDDYCFYHSGNEVPPVYNRFALLAMAGALLECRVWLDWSYGEYAANLFTCLCGPQGVRKSSAAINARKILQLVDPEHPFGESVISKESTIKRLASPDAKRSFRRGERTVVYEPVTFVLTELKNSLAINPAGLVDWLTHVYEGEDTTSNTIRRGVEKVEHPVVTLLACETTDWLVERLRQHILSGGFSRRMIYVVEEDYPKRIANPQVPKGGHEAYARVVQRMRGLKAISGEVRLSKPARKWFDKWYEGAAPQISKFAKAWYTSKHVQLVKLAMILAALDDETLVLEVKHLKIALALLDSIEVNMFKLVAMAGRNPMLAPTYELLGALAKGAMAEHDARRMLFEWCLPREVEELIRHLQMTRQVDVTRNGNGTAYVHLHGTKAASARE